MYNVDKSSEAKFIRLVDDVIETFKVQQQEFVLSPFFKEYRVSWVVGKCHGLLCLFCFTRNIANHRKMLVVWNPSIGKSFGIAQPRYPPRLSWMAYGFGVCPVTSDPTVVKVFCEMLYMPWHVEVFTLSSGVWNVIPSSKLPRQSIRLNPATQVVIDRFIYWGAYERTSGTINHMVVSFDLITKEFKVVNLSDNIRNGLDGRLLVLGVAKLRGSLVVYGAIEVEGAECCGVWVMEKNSSFKKLFTIGALVHKISGFSKSGEPLVETRNHKRALDVYDPCSYHIKSLGISAVEGSFVMDSSYKESLLLLDHSDLHIYPYVN
ncbi:probable galacturonosyltransferase 7 isoform X2 [Tanacetum coccineum]